MGRWVLFPRYVEEDTIVGSVSGDSGTQPSIGMARIGVSRGASSGSSTKP